MLKLHFKLTPVKVRKAFICIYIFNYQVEYLFDKITSLAELNKDIFFALINFFMTQIWVFI